MRKISKLLIIFTVFSLAFFSYLTLKNNKLELVADTKDESLVDTYDGGTHIHDSVKRSSYFIENGTSTYSILIDDDADTIITQCASDLQLYLEKATGVTLKIVSNPVTDVHYISLGNTILFESSNINLKELNGSRNGYIITTKDDNIFLASNGSYGVSNAVYGFLEEIINYQCYSDTCIVYDTKESINMYDFNVVEIPDFEWRVANYGIAKETGSSLLSRRLKMNMESDIWLPIGSYYHNCYSILNPNVYAKDHPDWYYGLSKNSSGSYEMQVGQLCYSNEEMRVQLVENLKEFILDNPGIENVTVTQCDNNDWCQCSQCKASKEKYGTNSAVLIKCMNKVHRDIVKWMKESQLDWDLDIAFFTYLPTVDAPVIKENGEYKPIDEEVICDDGVSAFYAPIEAVYSEDFYSENNENFYENMLKWSTISKEVYLWVYSTNFYHYLAPFDTYDSMQNIYKFAAKCGIKYIYDQAQMNNLNGTDFYSLKLYLNSKLQWNVNLDVKELTTNFFDNSYGDGSKYMQKYFYELRSRFKYIENELGVKFYIYIETEKRNYWPLPLLNQWLLYIEDAKDAIKSLKYTDEELYNLMIDRMTLESMSLRYLKIQLYSDVAYNDVTLLEEKKAFKNDATRFNITRFKEGGMLSQLYQSWRLS